MSYLTIDRPDIRPRDGDITMEARSPAIDRTRYPELSRITVDALAVWLLALVFGAAFWALLFHIAVPLIVRFV
jgi:energy-coupling factor transporter transmembrane protein EcfT